MDGLSIERRPPLIDAQSSKKCIVFLLEYEPTKDFVRRFFVEELVADGYSVEYWNVGPIMGLEGVEEIEVGGLDYELISDLPTLKHKLSRTAKMSAIVVPQITRTPKSRSIHVAVSRAAVLTAFFGRGYLPFLSEAKSTEYVVERLLRSPTDILRALARRARMFGSPISKNDVTFVAGTVAEEYHAKDSRQLVPIHHGDVDQAFSLDTHSGPPKTRTAVFLDSFLPSHPDFSMYGRASVEPARYYEQLRQFFDAAEKLWDLRFVIAAHPRSSYPTHPFGDRDVVYGRTAELVRDADVAVSQGSTATAFAIIYRKPIVLLHSPDLAKVLAPEYSQILRTAELLQCGLVDTSSTASIPKIVGSVEDRLYGQYYRRYLSARDDREHSSVVVISTLNSLLKTSARD